MNYLHIIFVSVVSSIIPPLFQQFDHTINDPMQYGLNLQNTNAGDTMTNNVIPQSKNTPNRNNNTLQRPNSEIWRQVGEIKYAEVLSMLIDTMIKNHSPNAQQMTPTSAPKTQTQHNNAQLPSRNIRQFHRFRKRMLNQLFG